MSEKITDHVDRAIGRLIESARNRQSHRDVVKLETTEAQAIEDVLWDLSGDSIDTAVGAQLDVWGRTVGQPRGGMADDTYRVWVRAKLQVNRSRGTGDDLIRLLQTLAPECSVRLLEEFPAGQTLRLAGVAPLAPVDAIAAMVRKADLGGVRTLVAHVNAPDAETFTLDSGPGLDVGVLADVKE